MLFKTSPLFFLESQLLLTDFVILSSEVTSFEVPPLRTPLSHPPVLRKNRNELVLEAKPPPQIQKYSVYTNFCGKIAQTSACFPVI